MLQDHLMALQEAKICGLQTDQCAIEKSAASFGRTFDHLDGIRCEHKDIEMSQIVNGPLDLTALDLEHTALPIPGHAESQLPAMRWMLNRAVQTDHLRPPAGQLRASNAAKRS